MKQSKFLVARTLRWLVVVACVQNLRAEFGVVTGDRHYTVDSGVGLVFEVAKENGDVASIKFHGKELQLRGRRKSGINSGVGSQGATTRVERHDGVVVVSLSTDETNGVVAGMRHYYIVREGENTIYMATYAENEPSNGELRWITRLDSKLFPEVLGRSDIRESTGAIESKDVFGMSDGTTRSKYYGNQHAKDLAIRGVRGRRVGVFMVYGNRESSSGGPFFRDIQNQTGSAAEVYNYMNSGHNQTEPRRLRVLYGPYALCFTRGEEPEVPDMGFISGLGLKGHVSEAERGRVAVDRIDGRDRKHHYLVAFANNVAQYWTEVDPRTGASVCPRMKPGRYTMGVFKGELAVHTGEVYVEPGKDTALGVLKITDDPSAERAVWRIGDWDGTPLEFRNGGNLSLMHPSDPRNADWNDDTFLVGRSRDQDFPACQWKSANGGREIKFRLARDQVGDCTVRIGITCAVAGARPNIRMNDWSPRRLPKPSAQPDSRSMTIGTYRGSNVTYEVSVPGEALRAGTNTLTISPISGQSGSGFLSPGYALDCIDLIANPPKP